MSQFHKFSMLYDVGEDRLGWDVEGVDGEVTRLWFTQRLSKGFVEALVALLQKRQDAPAEHASLVQSWEQVAALDGFGNAPPVQPNPQMAVGLVSAVHMSPTDIGASFTFDFGEGESRSIAMAVAAIRQTLSVMYRLYVSAAWPLDVWPEWVADPASRATTAADAIN